jgi:hypothetical protein
LPHGDSYHWSLLRQFDLISSIGAQIFAFERDIGCALRGIAPARAGGTLTAREFLMMLQDLLTFTVERWETPEKRTARTLDQHAMYMRSLALTLFDNEHHVTIARNRRTRLRVGVTISPFFAQIYARALQCAEPMFSSIGVPRRGECLPYVK